MLLTKETKPKCNANEGNISHANMKKGVTFVNQMNRCYIFRSTGRTHDVCIRKFIIATATLHSSQQNKRDRLKDMNCYLETLTVSLVVDETPNPFLLWTRNCSTQS